MGSCQLNGKINCSVHPRARESLNKWQPGNLQTQDSAYWLHMGLHSTGEVQVE